MCDRQQAPLSVRNTELSQKQRGQEKKILKY